MSLLDLEAETVHEVQEVFPLDLSRRSVFERDWVEGGHCLEGLFRKMEDLDGQFSFLGNDRGLSGRRHRAWTRLAPCLRLCFDFRWEPFEAF